MPIQIKCECGKSLRVKDEAAGKKVRCPGCKAILTAPEPEFVEPDEDTAVSLTQLPPKPAAKRDVAEDETFGVTAGAPKAAPWSKSDDDEDEEVDRPRSRRRRRDQDDDEDEDRPRRKRKRRRDDEDEDDRPRRRRPPRNPNAVNTQFGAIAAGILMMVGATVWCIAGLAFDWFFYYPPILFIVGIVTVIRGALNKE
jgi:hypothetical protein